MGSQITDAKGALNSALGLSQNLQRDIPALNEWIDSVEVQLDEFEAPGGINTNSDLQVAYLKVRFIISFDFFKACSLKACKLEISCDSILLTENIRGEHSKVESEERGYKIII